MSKRVLLIIGGGIAAYKSLELIRRLKERGLAVRVVMTEAAQRFVTTLAAGALVGEPVFTDLFDQAHEFDVGHIRLARECDLIIVAPATADLMAKRANGLANDLASAVLLATDKPVLMAPAMNPHMWSNAATRRNFATLQADGIRLIGPNAGEMAERGESGVGRMAEPEEIRDTAIAFLSDGPLKGKRALVTAGPTIEAIDPVRFLSNRSSGKQGYAIAAALAELGADVTLVSGPTNLAAPAGVTRVNVESARDMLEASEAALPLDVAVMVAAVADWRPTQEAQTKIKKDAAGIPAIALQENPDILATLSKPGKKRPKLVVGFAAETDHVEEHARAKIAKKGCDWIVANDVSGDVMGGAENAVILISKDKSEAWPRMAKEAVARKLAAEIAKSLGAKAPRK
ncbi:bifunctional phosphopantothenoylcysteine decarboxylase/phosphopantothenate--cysteine ligase CoaBC [Candidatus Viadribacter manganicus]|uniref:Coenzyme A biosynthesis bifunctional protein CoaBC n=1 Tax=Candidatus Viadribacter manganicus TaxID=1759059 RepID=A0A1B1AIM7_9PROT|nr:bifunctional phosphopantothenoylcysteine decarboxylase/phosphopantothenate--cysteine ligase CoaBC [Candidatus Viadribacter manganicus]ANP46405.1 bifunctional phosphopantothenoylcysteine decarboxylase/phosphopantothenate synthase [Candidatus Viadribacter manganicus]